MPAMDYKLLALGFVALIAQISAVAEETARETHTPVRWSQRNVLLGAGQRPSGNVFIVKGKVATPGQFPYQVAIFTDMTEFCGGSVISDQWILTAAHCVDGYKRFIVFLNAFNMLLPKEKNRIVTASAEGIAHKDYDSNTYLNDVGLIRLQRKISTTNVSPVALPARSYKLADGQTAQLSGWGVTSQGYTVINPELNYAQLSVISQAECAKTYGYIVITDEKLCTGTGADQQSPCKGDTGGALVVSDTAGKFTQIGIASFVSQKGCEEGAPVGFARVTSFLDWINQKTGIEISA